MRVDRIRAGHVLRVLNPIWHTIPETARRVRQRIHSVLSWCHGHEYVADNVADDRLDGVLDRHRDTPEHLRSLPFAEIAQFVRVLQSGRGSPVNKPCLLFTILTATRGSEARGACWSEIDEPARMWRITGSRMKMRADHHQPLSGPARPTSSSALGRLTTARG